jgi:branched-subunit amino acid aminotransferase/4-amino-4-deoxychorismate lyase
MALDRAMDCYLQGRILPEVEACVPLLDRGFMLGDGIFETIAIHGGRPEFLSQHLERMFHSAEALLIPVPVTAPQLVEILDELIARNEVSYGRARITLSRGVPVSDFDDATPRPWTDDWKPTLSVVVRPVTNAPAPAAVKLITATRLMAPGTVARQHKSLSYLDLLHARHIARERGAFDALLLNTNGHVMEASIANVMWLDAQGHVCTPSLEAGCLPGIMRGVAIAACRAQGVRVIEGQYPVADMLRARSVWAMNSTLRAVPVTHLDVKELNFDASAHDRLTQALDRRAAESRHDHTRLPWWR